MVLCDFLCTSSENTQCICVGRPTLIIIASRLDRDMLLYGVSD